MHKENVAYLFTHPWSNGKNHFPLNVSSGMFCTHGRVTESRLVNKCLYLALRGSDCMRQQHVNAHSRQGKEENKFGRHPPPRGKGTQVTLG